MNGPYMKSAVPAGQYHLDPYFAVLLTKIDGLGPAQLLHVLVVYKTGEADPVFFVTAEIERRPAGARAQARSTDRNQVPESTDPSGAPAEPAVPGTATASEMAAVPCLCTFAEDGTHSHLDYSPVWADLHTFAARAVEIVKERYGVTEVSAPDV